MQVIVFYTPPPTQPKAKSNYLRNAVRDCASAIRTYGSGPTLLEECPILQTFCEHSWKSYCAVKVDLESQNE